MPLTVLKMAACVGADAEGQSEDRDGGEAGRFPQQTEAVT